jgi:hypothetical protein
MRHDGDGRFRNSHDAHGTIAPLSNWRTGTFDASVRPPDRTDATDASPWEGMSGAAVWADDRLIGVVIEHHHAEGPAMLTAARLDAPGLEAVGAVLGWPADARQLPVTRRRYDAHLRPRRLRWATGRPRMPRIRGALSLRSIVLFVVLILGVEAAARGRLLSLLVGLALAALTVALAAAVVTALFQNWRVVLAYLLGLVAVALLVVNVRELRC